MATTHTHTGWYSRPGSTLTANSAGSLMLWLALLLCSSSAGAQANASDSMPPWTVLVLKLVSTTHVQPTTGIVIAAPDLVLVAGDFARAGDEIMVLDGGTDIVRHGRPASIVHTLPADKLAILRVQGLNRPAAQLSSVSLASIGALNLVAFPPAENIAQGATPVRTSIKTLAAITTANPTLEPFPNVSGALTDSCGRLVAFNLSSGLQSMQPAASPRLAWADALKRAAALTGSEMQLLDCSAAESQEDQPKAAEQAASEEAAAPEPEKKAEIDPQADTGMAAPESPEEPLQQEAEAGDQQVDPAVDPAAEEPAVGVLPELYDDPLGAEEAEAVSNGTGDGQGLAAPRRLSTPGWIIAGVLSLLLLAWWLHRQRKGAASNSGTLADNLPIEPGTVRFEAAGKGSATVRLKITGQTPDGEEFIQQLPVSGPGWIAELGRQEADVDLASPTVSRRHARLELHEGRITVTDLDSTNGTRVNGVPCLPGEVFFVQADDVVQLGEVQLHLQLTTGEDL